MVGAALPAAVLADGPGAAGQEAPRESGSPAPTIRSREAEFDAGGRSAPAATLLLGTRSAHKASEVAAILAAAASAAQPTPLDGIGLAWSEEEDAIERWATFEENAAAKARYFAHRSGLPTIADDSGLEVDSLDGRPGVRSKRFAPLDAYPGMAQDDANIAHLLEIMADVPLSRRGARYVCVATFYDPETDVLRRFRGEAPGRILPSPRGVGGFGYDPVFAGVGSALSFAELAPAAKNERSHRGKAFRALAERLRRAAPA